MKFFSQKQKKTRTQKTWMDWNRREKWEWENERLSGSGGCRKNAGVDNVMKIVWSKFYNFLDELFG